MKVSTLRDPFDRWFAALQARHLADLRFEEVTRALRALSSTYVERRSHLARGAALQGAGKRAAFALFYAPLHFLLVRAIVRTLDPTPRPLDRIVDLGCGTGAAGAAWGVAQEDQPRQARQARPRVWGIDLHPWAAAEAAWTYRTLGLRGHARRGDLSGARLPGADEAVVAAFTINELKNEPRVRVHDTLLEAAARGARILIVEPLARATAPWWDDWRAAFEAAGGRADEWRFELPLPDLLRKLDRSAGLDHRVLSARSLWIDRDAGTSSTPSSGK